MNDGTNETQTYRTSVQYKLRLQLTERTIVWCRCVHKMRKSQHCAAVAKCLSYCLTLCTKIKKIEYNGQRHRKSHFISLSQKMRWNLQMSSEKRNPFKLSKPNHNFEFLIIFDIDSKYEYFSRRNRKEIADTFIHPFKSIASARREQASEQ